MTGVRFPLSVFDFFAYFLQGFLLLIGIAILLNIEVGGIISTTNLFLDLVVVVVSYILGHVISELSRWLIEGKLVKRHLGYPSDFVFSEERNKMPFFSEYLSTYSKEFISDFKEVFNKKYANKFSRIDDYNAFLLCFHTVKENCPNAFSRLNIFISMYDFSRNLTLVFLIYAVIFTAISISRSDFTWILGVFLSLIFAFIFLKRYLKFFKAFANEVYYSFYNHVKGV